MPSSNGKRIRKYDIYANVSSTGCINVGKLALREEHSTLNLAAFRYSEEYLVHPSAFPLDPVQLPLAPTDFQLPCKGKGIPGILDDYLPDDWGKRVLAHLAFYQSKRRINETSAIDLLANLGGNRIGALSIVAEGNTSTFDMGADIALLEKAEITSQFIAEDNYEQSKLDEHSLIYLSNAGNGVGGARPKALISDGEDHYLAKFNSLSHDNYNNARVELACLNMAKSAGLDVYLGQVKKGINNREALLLKRFDIDGQRRNHLITVNALLKDEATQQDRGGAFRYDDIANLIRKWSTTPREDLEHLLRQMLFNAAINNTDDHERNFSFIYRGDGYQLAPAYDMVPSLSIGQYHVAGYQYSPSPPRPSEVTNRVFDLPMPATRRICEEVSDAISQWKNFAEDTNVSEDDFQQLQKVIKP